MDQARNVHRIQIKHMNFIKRQYQLVIQHLMKNTILSRILLHMANMRWQCIILCLLSKFSKMYTFVLITYLLYVHYIIWLFIYGEGDLDTTSILSYVKLHYTIMLCINLKYDIICWQYMLWGHWLGIGIHELILKFWDCQ